MLILTATELDCIIQEQNFSDTEAEEIEDSLLSTLLKYIHVIEDLESKTISDSSISTVCNLFYSHYYWFNQLKVRYNLLYGHDEGLEQQSYKILCDFDDRFPEQIDWNIIEKIDEDTF